MNADILIMAKAPRPGQAKTRLEPVLEPRGCARLQAELIRHTAAWAASAVSRAWLAYAPSDARAEVAALVPDGVRLFPQAGRDLGQRLTHAARHVHDRGGNVLVVIGTDSPLLAAAHVTAARRALLDGHDAALVPALDGGYGLIALADPAPRAFAIPPTEWGGPDVLALTLQALRSGGLRVAVLEPVGDLDTPADARALYHDARCPAEIRATLAPVARQAA